ncbi:MAG: hypothetical protein ACRELY_12910, partial [Polyangiaceae bacterium]
KRAQKATPFSTVFGITPTENGGVKRMAQIAKRLRPRVVALVDGDAAGDDYAKDIASTPNLAEAIIQWPKAWTIEDVVGWILEAGGKDGIAAAAASLEETWPIDSTATLVALLKEKNDAKLGKRGLKEDVVAHDAIVANLTAASLTRVGLLLDALTSSALASEHSHYAVEDQGPPRRVRFVP